MLIVQLHTQLQFTFRRNSTNSTTHIRSLSIRLNRLRPIPKENKFTPALGTPPRNTVMRAFNVHLAITQRLPEPVDAGSPHLGSADGVDQPRCDGKPFFEVFHAEEAEGVD